MSLLGEKNECPRCHKSQRTREICSACKRTPALFPGMDTGHYKGSSKQGAFDFSVTPKAKR